jgi:hypothetical protein
MAGAVGAWVNASRYLQPATSTAHESRLVIVLSERKRLFRGECERVRFGMGFSRDAPPPAPGLTIVVAACRARPNLPSQGICTVIICWGSSTSNADQTIAQTRVNDTTSPSFISGSAEGELGSSPNRVPRSPRASSRRVRGPRRCF